MGQREYPAGTPSWVDVTSPDIDASAAFYGGLFGWEAVANGPAEETGGYRMFRRDGADVAGIGPTPEGGAPAWTVYVTVDDADATATAVEAAGGTLLLPPLDIPQGAGRMLVFADDQGAVCAAWQPGTHRGADVVDDPGCFVWSELACRDPEAAMAFYGSVFGWVGTTRDFGPTTYTTFFLGEGGRTLCGMVRMNDDWPAEVPPHWMTYIAVDDCDAAAARVTELGGEVSVPPTDFPFGRFSVVADPFGATFSIIRMADHVPTP